MFNSYCITLLSSLAPPSMPAPNGRSCIGSLCLKYLVICLANSLLATGWLLLSVLSLLADVVRALGGPPTFPKLPLGPVEETEKAPSLSKPALAPHVLERIRVERAVSLESYAKAHVKAVEDQEAIHTHATSPGSPFTAASSQLSEKNDVSSDLLPLSSSSLNTSSPHSSSPSASKPSRKLKLFRRSSERSRSSSRGAADERSSSGVKPCLIRVASGLDFTHMSHHKQPRPRSPVQRTDPYQAPYFFPTPLSPDAAGYAKRVRMERGGTSSPEDISFPLPASSAVSPTILPSEDVLETRNESDEVVGHAQGREQEWQGLVPPPLHETKERRGRPASWGSDLRSHRSKESVSSVENLQAPTPPSRSKRFWRRASLKNGNQLTPLTALDVVSSLKLFPEPVAPSPAAELKQKRSWFRRRQSLSVSNIPPLHAVTGELGELPPDSRGIGGTAGF